MASQQTRRLLTINVGSSSLKAVLYRLGPAETVEVRATAERIGMPNSRLRVADAQGEVLHQSFGRPPGPRYRAGGTVHLAPGPAPGRGAARHWAARRAGRQPVQRADADHRHAARARCGRSCPSTRSTCRRPSSVIESIRHAYPTVPQVACFDTAFHRQMPRVAQMYPLPRDLWDAGVARYGFHGLSYEYILQELRALDGDAADGRVIVAHLGHGASMAAVHHGVAVDTTMGLTPTGGLVMSTRTGDLDPGVLLYLARVARADPAALSRLVNKEAGLLGVSGSTADMQDLLAREAADPRAADAVALFCYQARKFLGGLVAALGGLDTLVFTAGIGEHAAVIRARICDGLGYLGLEVDAARNAEHAPIISSDASRVVVRVIPTDEDLMIARHTHRLIAGGGSRPWRPRMSST